MTKQAQWHKYFFEIALLSAKKSDDDSMGVGCVIVGPDNEIRTTGYNGLPRGLEYTKDKRERPAKYAWTEHAERNAIYNAARMGTSLKGCKAYVTATNNKKGGIVPCADCSRALIQSGVVEIVEINGDMTKDDGNRTWTQTTSISLELIKQSGVKLTLVDPVTWEEVEHNY